MWKSLADSIYFPEFLGQHLCFVCEMPRMDFTYDGQHLVTSGEARFVGDSDNYNSNMNENNNDKTHNANQQKTPKQTTTTAADPTAASNRNSNRNSRNSQTKQSKPTITTWQQSQ